MASITRVIVIVMKMIWMIGEKEVDKEGMRGRKLWRSVIFMNMVIFGG